MKTIKTQKKKLPFTFEILCPGTLKRKEEKRDTPEKRWEEIKDICADIIADYKNNFFA